MISYLDTSSLVTLYVEEEGSRTVSDLVKLSEVTATSLVAYPEARAAFARRFREKAFSAKDYQSLMTSFQQDWNNYFVIKLTSEVALLAGDLAEKHGLRGFDAIHLSSAITLRKECASPVIFSCADRNLQKASEGEDLQQL